MVSVEIVSPTGQLRLVRRFGDGNCLLLPLRFQPTSLQRDQRIAFELIASAPRLRGPGAFGFRRSDDVGAGAAADVGQL